MLTGLVLSVAMASTALPPGAPVANHAGIGKHLQPTIRRFERYEEDNERRLAWNAYCKELDVLWAKYRAAGSTPEAFKAYQNAALTAKRHYVYQDPYHTAVPESDPCPCDDGCGEVPCTKPACEKAGCTTK